MLNKLTHFTFSRFTVRHVPEEPGIYIFFDIHKKPIYVGKAIDLKKRLYSYTLRNLEPKTTMMVSKASYFSYVKVSSEIEALILEARLVGSFKPKYNIQLKDDKGPLYVVITKEYFPRVLTSRIPKGDRFPTQSTFGPFLSGRSVFFILKSIRKVFPFATHKPEKKACFYSHLGLCSPCPSIVERLKDSKKEALHKKYLENIKCIKKFLSGNISVLTDDLKASMIKLAKNSEFEKASKVKFQLEMIKNVTSPVISGERFMENPNLKEDLRHSELEELGKALNKHVIICNALKRIECYDVAHLGGKYPVASMVTFIDGDSDKRFYRHFKIIQKKSVSDVDSMYEVGKRRIKYFESWGIPDLILVDGGKTQVAKMQAIFEDFKIPVVGIAKMSASLIIPIAKNVENKYVYTVTSLQNKKYTPLILRLKDEAHRFARSLHHKLLQKSYNIAV